MMKDLPSRMHCVVVQGDFASEGPQDYVDVRLLAEWRQ